MTQRKSLYALTLGLAGMAGCLQTEVTPSVLESRLADGKVDLTDYRTIDAARGNFSLKYTQAADDAEKAKYLGLIGDVNKLLEAFKGGAKLKLKLTTDFWAPSGEYQNLDGTEDSGKIAERVIEVTYNTLKEQVGSEKANKVLESMISRWEPTTRRVKTLVQVTPDELRRLARGTNYESVVEPLFNEGFKLSPDTQAIYAVFDGNFTLDGLQFNVLGQKPVEPKKEVKTEEPKKE